VDLAASTNILKVYHYYINSKNGNTLQDKLFSKKIYINKNFNMNNLLSKQINKSQDESSATAPHTVNQRY